MTSARTHIPSQPGSPLEAGSLIARHLDPAALLRDAPDAMLLVDDSGLVIYANLQTEAMFGHPLTELVGRSVDLLLPSDRRDRHREHRDGYAGSPSIRPMGAGLDLLGQRADGTVFPVEISLSPVELDTQRLTLAAVRDVSRQRQAELALRRSEETFRLTFASSPVGIAILHLDGSWAYVNPAMCRLTGRSEAELLATALSDLLPDEPLQLDVTAAGPGRVERRLQRADGDSAWLEITLSTVRDSFGAPQHLVGHFYDVTERRAHQHEMQSLALSDPLTGLPNRTLLLDRTSQALSKLARRPGRCALLVLDLDHFKNVNDSLGHLAGDELLRQVARRLAAGARGSDTVARLGGDEFAVLFTEFPPGDENRLGIRLLEALVHDFELPTSDGALHVVHIGASIGIAVSSDPGCTAMDLYRDADVALYDAKAHGRGRVRVFDVSLREALEVRLEDERRLRAALLDGGVQILLQPLVRLADQHVAAHEVLARIAVPGDPELVLPARFLPIAQEKGLVPALDLQVLQLCLAELKQRPGSLHLNVSVASLEHDSWMQSLMEGLDEHPELASRLCIELTEEALMSASSSAVEALAELRRLGLRVGLDDFGTGYSSLSYLERLRVDFLKLDTTLIGRITHSQSSQVLAQGIVRLAKDLGLRVVAEGIEEPLQQELLRSWGCDVGQGYLFGRPAPIAT